MVAGPLRISIQDRIGLDSKLLHNGLAAANRWRSDPLSSGTGTRGTGVSTPTKPPGVGVEWQSGRTRHQWDRTGPRLACPLLRLTSTGTWTPFLALT